MYGLWLFKEIKTEYGYCKVEIYRRGYNGSQIEIGALSADSLNISLENLSAITDPIGKSVCSFSIIDTDQINYEDFFTPDATAFKVVVSTMVRGANSFTTRWSGFLTPDFFAENLSYRTPISLTARDNIGYLNDVDFDMPDSTVTVRQLIQAAFAKISDNYPMNLAFASQKQTAEGVLAIDATISTALLRDMSWYEAVETILHDLGLQMRWVDNNTIAVMDLSQIPEYYATQGFNFVGASGYREILPAWRQLSQSQEYGLRENFFEGQITPQNITFAKEEVLTASSPIFEGNYTTTIKYYTPNNWGRAGEMYTINPADFFNGKERFKGRIFFTGIQSNIVNYSGNYMSWRQPILHSNWPMLIKFNAYNAIMAPNSLLGLDLQNLVLYADSEDKYQIGVKVNVLLHSGTTTYILKQNWEVLSGNENTAIEFILPELTYNGAPQEEELSIEIGSIPHDGELELRIYGFFLNPKYDLNIAIAEGVAIKMVSYISEVAYTYDTNVIPTGQDRGVTINEQHNIKNSDDYTFGQVPYRSGGINAFAGGLYNPSGNELVGFQRNAGGENYNLLELVGREVIHFNKKNYNKLSGTIKNLDKEPLMFNRLFVREGKTYAPFSYSLNVISNEMNITTMQEVEPYDTASFTQIESEVTTGGATVSGGNNTVLQYSENAGNAKRVFELNAATETEKNDGYLLLDNPSFGEAKKVHISEVKDTQLRAEVEDLRADFDNLNNLLNDDTSGVIDTWNEVVDFLEGYKDSEDLATILSGINATVGGLADTLATEQGYIDTLQGYFVNGIAKKATADALGNVITDTYATKVALNAVDDRVKTLEALGLTLEVKDGVTYVKSKYSFYTLGGLASGEPSSSEGGGGTVGGSNVSFKAELLSGTKIGTITIDNVATNIYAPSALPNPYALTINGITYDGSSAVDVTISGGSGVADSVAWANVYNKPTTLAGYGITDALSTSGGILSSGAFAPLTIKGNSSYAGIGLQKSGESKPSYLVYIGEWDWRITNTNWADAKKLLHSGNYSSYALPITGGDLTNSTWGATLRLKGDGTSAGLQFYNSGTFMGLLYAYTDGPAWYKDASNIWPILHTGNYSTYALPVSGGTINGTNETPLFINSSSTQSRIGFGVGSVQKALVGYHPTYGVWLYSYPSGKFLGIKDDGTPFYYSGQENTLIHSGNIGAQSVSYATSAGDADSVDGYSSNGLLQRTYQGRTSMSAKGWYRVAVFKNVGAVGNTARLHLYRGYNNSDNEAYIFEIVYIYGHGYCITQVAGDYNTRLITKVRIDSVSSTSAYAYIDVYYNGTVANTLYWLTIGCATAYSTAEAVSSLSGTAVEITTISGLKTSGNIYATGGLASGQASDRRLKENILKISTTDAVSVLRKLNPISFKWNELATSLDARNTGDSVGFIADEYEGVIVNSGRDIWEKYRAIDYTKAIPYLAKGWQVHDTILVKHADNIEDLRTRVEVLERENRELKERLNMRA